MRKINLLTFLLLSITLCLTSCKKETEVENEPAPEVFVDYPSPEIESCLDNTKNGTESDIDCGGTTCVKCDSSRSCSSNSDCKSFLCSYGSCQEPSCSDNVKNGNEVDMDCGGPCSACDYGSFCNKGTDCQTNNCYSNVCVQCRTDADCSSNQVCFLGMCGQ